MTEISCDVLVVGGSLGGVSAALSAARSGKNVLLLCETTWLGGQMTSQGVCTPDENEFVETTGSTQSYREFRQRTRQHYETTYTLSALGKASVNRHGHLELGESWVSTGYSVEAKVGQLILQQMLQELNVDVRSNVTVTNVAISADGNMVTSVVGATSDGDTLNITAHFVLDATDLGDLLPMARVEYNLGAESQDQTNEPDASTDGPHASWIQPITFPITLELRPSGEDHTIPKPDNYETIRDAQKFSLIDGCINGVFIGRSLPKTECNGMGSALWTYRRVVEVALFTPTNRPYNGDVSNINVGSNDYLEGVIPSGDPASDATSLAAARQVSLCYLYWLQTECQRDPGDGSTTGYPNLRPATEFWDTPDAISPDPYIREGRRIQALTTVKEQDIAAEDANGHDLQTGSRARLFQDTCGIGHYGIDIHPNSVGLKWMGLSTKPYQIPLGALVPVRITNLLPACKNIGVTHITNGAYRLHPIEWNVGEAASALAVFCIDQDVAPQAVVQSDALTLDYQKGILNAGVPLFWWTDVVSDMSCFAAVQMLGVRGVVSGDPDSLAFRPSDTITAQEQQDLANAAGIPITWPQGILTRGDAAVVVAQAMSLV